MARFLYPLIAPTHENALATMTPQTQPGESPSTSDLQTLLKEPPARAWWRRPVVWGTVALIAGVAGGLYFWQMDAQRKAVPVFVTEPVSLGNLTLTV